VSSSGIIVIIEVVRVNQLSLRFEGGTQHKNPASPFFFAASNYESKRECLKISSIYLSSFKVNKCRHMETRHIWVDHCQFFSKTSKATKNDQTLTMLGLKLSFQYSI